MTNLEAKEKLYMEWQKFLENNIDYAGISEAYKMAFKALDQEPIDKSAMMCEIYMEGVNMTGEHQGCWVRFKDIEKIINKYMAESEESDADSN